MASHAFGEMPTSGEYTEYGFIHGDPESLIQADQDPRILIEWPHGDETLGPRTGYRLYSEQPELLANVDYLCGNPLAAGQDPALRYTGDTPGYDVSGTDLNRSFTPGVPSQSYEQHRAADILQAIEQGRYGYVLDMHTTTTDSGRYIIVDERFLNNQAVQDIIAASPVQRVVVFPEWVARDGLIGNVPNSVTIEYNRQLADEIGVDDTMLTIQGLIKGKSLIPVRQRQRELFRVTELIPKDRDPGLDSKNFVLCRDGYYPVLFGNNSYRRDPTKRYLGFAATTKEVVSI